MVAASGRLAKLILLTFDSSGHLWLIKAWEWTSRAKSRTYDVGLGYFTEGTTNSVTISMDN